MNGNEMGTIQPELPNIVGLSHICIFVDDMEQAVDYYRALLGVTARPLPVPLEKRRAFSRREDLWMRRLTGTSPSPL